MQKETNKTVYSFTAFLTLVCIFRIGENKRKGNSNNNIHPMTTKSTKHYKTKREKEKNCIINLTEEHKVFVVMIIIINITIVIIIKNELIIT